MTFAAVRLLAVSAVEIGTTGEDAVNVEGEEPMRTGKVLPSARVKIFPGPCARQLLGMWMMLMPNNAVENKGGGKEEDSHDAPRAACVEKCLWNPRDSCRPSFSAAGDLHSVDRSQATHTLSCSSAADGSTRVWVGVGERCSRT
jgi:hypothetical protein